MNFSENLLTEIMRISKEKSLNLVEALSEFCEENDYPPEDIIKKLDRNVCDLLKAVAAKHRMVRRVCYRPVPNLECID